MIAPLPVFENATNLRAWVCARRAEGRRIAFVPTMGNLHDGHYSLVRHARAHSDCLVASVFVNPTQFAPGEDFERYPRTPAEDIAGLTESGCDALFLPSVAEIYPDGPDTGTRINVGELGRVLEGASRPGHFDGVATVVATLFHIVQPDVAVFGSKDYQQLLVIREMVRDLAFPVEIEAVATRREPDGLAMSSRNRYLGNGERANAAAIHATLEWMGGRVRSGAAIESIERDALSRLRENGLVPDYAVVRRSGDLTPPFPGASDALIALIAAKAGATRLIDNLAL